MAKRRRELDFDGIATETAEYNTVFADTSLDTHLAMLVSKSDTVSDFKKKMVLEHMQCFPKIEIHIQSLMVKRRAKFYHLPDSMHVWSAFHGVKGNWFLLVDASGTPSCHLNQDSTELALSDCMKMGVRNVDNNWKGISSDIINRIQTLPMPLPDGVTKKNVVSEMIPGLKFENSLEKTTDIQNSNSPEKNCMETKSPAKKKRKMRHTEGVCQNPSFDATAEVLGVRNDQSVLDDKVVFEGTSVPAVAEKSNIGSTVNCQDHLGSDERKVKTVLESIIPDLVASKKEYELGQDVQADHSGVVSIKVPNLSARSMDASGAAEDVNSNETKRKKKKAQETATNIQDTADVEQTLKGESIKPYTETHKSEEKDEEKHFSLNRNHEVEMPSSYKASDHANRDLTQKEAPEITSCSKKKNIKTKKANKLVNTDLEKSGIEQTDNGISGCSGLLCPSTGHIPEEAGKEESILYPNGEDVQLKFLKGSTLDAGEKVLGANGNEEDFVMSTQTKQTLEAVPDGKREMDKETQNSAGNGREDSPVLEKENQILEFNQVEKDSENTVKMDKKAKKKRRNKILTASDVQENLPVKDQKVGVGVSTTEENSISFVNSETEGIHVASSQVLSLKSGKNLEKHFSLNRNHEVEMPSSYKASDHANPDLTQKEAPEITSCSKKKNIKTKKANKSANTDREKSGIEQTDNGISGCSGLLCPSTGNIPEEAGKEESILYPNGEDIQLKLLNGSTLDAGEKVLGANGNEEDFVMSTQTKQTLEAVPDGKREMDKETQNSAGNGPADSPVLEKENQILEFNQVEKDSENTVNMDKKAKKKRRNKILTASDVQENLPVKDQKVGVGVSTTEENSISFVNSETEGIHVASSQVLSLKSGKNLEEKHDIAVNTDDLAKTTEDEGKGINFKQYFVPGQYQEKVGSPGKVKKANQSNMEMKTLKKVKKNGLPSVSISTEVQSSLSLYANQESDNKTPARKDSDKRQGDSAQNSDWDEVLPNSSRTRRSSRVPKNGVKDSITSEMAETNIQKPKEILAESSIPNKKNASLKKSSSERSEKIPGKIGNKRSQSGLHVTNRMEMKTPEKKSLLTKPGAIFHDNSGESSGDENGSARSSGSTRSPSDSSSMSNYTVGESELSQDSTKNGSSDAQGRSTGAKDTSKFELSAPENITMHMILRSSKCFKKAKLMASQNKTDQNESEPIEFVPDNLPM